MVCRKIWFDWPTIEHGVQDTKHICGFGGQVHQRLLERQSEIGEVIEHGFLERRRNRATEQSLKEGSGCTWKPIRATWLGAQDFHYAVQPIRLLRHHDGQCTLSSWAPDVGGRTGRCH